jgi:NAD(P)-dependent dehydrogenase (short-subunit alcohol dehydrogenase family)
MLKIQATSQFWDKCQKHQQKIFRTHWALIGMTNSLARELGGDGITVNCIRPGTVATEVAERVASLTPEIRQRNIDLQCIPRTVVPADLVGLTMFLSTPAAAFITGQTIACDGGYTHSF